MTAACAPLTKEARTVIKSISLLTRKDDGRESLARALATPQAKALYADGALFIGRIKTFTVEEQVIV